MIKKKLPHTVPPYVIYGFFFLGLISAVAFRLIIVLQRFEPAWVRPVWYAGVLGYIGFFMYRYAIARKRKKVIKHYDLIEKVKTNACLSEEDREVVIYLLSSLKKSLEDVNYLLIFLFSLLAILADIIFSMRG
ncbi:MAG: hypothetical protein C4560_05375 [Nitrospiraceae bacterium]|nr:MAG: hypothetical protein C4560_05375 [Nitrospiraceae bacterium]